LKERVFFREISQPQGKVQPWCGGKRDGLLVLEFSSLGEKKQKRELEQVRRQWKKRKGVKRSFKPDERIEIPRREKNG